MFVAENHVYNHVYKPCISIMTSGMTQQTSGCQNKHGNIYAGKTSAVLNIEYIKISGQQERWDSI